MRRGCSCCDVCNPELLGSPTAFHCLLFVEALDEGVAVSSRMGSRVVVWMMAACLKMWLCPCPALDRGAG